MTEQIHFMMIGIILIILESLKMVTFKSLHINKTRRTIRVLLLIIAMFFASLTLLGVLIENPKSIYTFLFLLFSIVWATLFNFSTKYSVIGSIHFGDSLVKIVEADRDKVIELNTVKRITFYKNDYKGASNFRLSDAGIIYTSDGINKIQLVLVNNEIIEFYFLIEHKWQLIAIENVLSALDNEVIRRKYNGIIV